MLSQLLLEQKFYNKMSKLLTKKTWISLALILILAPIFIFGETASSQNYNFIEDSGIAHTADIAGFETGTGAASVDSIVARIIFIALGLLGVVFLAFMLLGGFNWMTSSGNEEKVKKAKETLLNYLIGILITLAAYAISYFLISYFS